MKSELTAIHRHKPSLTARLVANLGIVKESVFDFGCGTGRDVIYLRSLGYHIEAWDPYFNSKTPPSHFPKGYFKTILCTYVLNVISRKERLEVLKNVRRLLATDGCVVVTVRSSSEIAEKARLNNWKKVRDGWLTKRSTFQKGFTPKELGLLLRKCEFMHVLTILCNPVIVIGYNKRHEFEKLTEPMDMDKTLKS